MPTWDEVAEKQRETLQGAGVVASDAGAIAALLAGKAGRVQLALLDLGKGDGLAHASRVCQRPVSDHRKKEEEESENKDTPT